MKELQIAIEICDLIQKAGYDCVFCGGMVRDKLNNIPFNDIDIATSAKPEEVSNILTGFYIKEVGKSFGITLVEKDSFIFEVATFRKDFNCDGRHADVEFATMQEDCLRRDFTINAIYYDPIKDIYFDFVNGIEDVKNKRLRFVGKASDRIAEDYLRILRFVRFWIKGYSPEVEDIITATEMSADLLKFVAPDRISKELMEKILTGDVYRYIDRLKHMPTLLKVLFPELVDTITCEQNPVYHPEGTVWNHTVWIVKYLHKMNAKPLLMLAGLLHDIGKPSCTEIIDDHITSHGHEQVGSQMVIDLMTKYHFSNENIEYVSGLVADHMKLHYDMKKSTLRRLMNKNYFDDLVKLAEADTQASNEDFTVLDKHKVLIEEIRNNPEPVFPKPIITGNTLIKLKFKPSPQFKIILDHVMDLQLEGIITNEQQGINAVMSFLGVV